MRTPQLVVVAAVAAACTLAPPAAEAKHRKPLKDSYDLTLPVPFPGESASGSHCADAPDDLSRDVRTLTLPSSGRLKVTLSRHKGDWVVELNDPKGRLIGAAGGLNTSDTGSLALSYKKKSTRTEKFTLSVCNYTGGPEGHVDWVYTFDT